MANRKRVKGNPERNAFLEWGIPDWRKLDGYPTKWEALTADQRRWEFLRRDEGFREDWARSRNPQPTNLEMYPKSVRRFISPYGFDNKTFVRKYALSRSVSPQTNWKDLPENFHFLRVQEIGGQIVYPDTPVPFSKAALVKGGTVERDKKLAVEAKRQARNSFPSSWYDMIVWVEFDLECGIDEQIKIAKNNLRKTQIELKNFMKELETSDNKYDVDDYVPRKVGIRKSRAPNNRAKDREYSGAYAVSLLRIYDARKCNRTEKEISQGLFNSTGENLTESAVGKRYKRALSLWRSL